MTGILRLGTFILLNIHNLFQFLNTNKYKNKKVE